jgi:hypothetical protein
MHKTVVCLSLLTLIAYGLFAALPSAACGSCSCTNIQHVTVNCAACDKTLDTYPMQQGSNNSCTQYTGVVLYCCDDPRVPETSSGSLGQCSGGSCPIGENCTLKVRPTTSEPLKDSR